MKTFFTADLHLFDEDIAKARGFNSAQEYRDMMLDRWNNTVGKKDLVYILGDISKEEQKEAVCFIQNKLAGYKVLVPGNHDSIGACMQFKAHWCHTVVPVGTSLKIGDANMLLTHIPVHPDELFFYRGNLHGHIHGPIPELGYIPNEYPHVTNPRNMGTLSYFNVNLEFHDYQPISEDIIKEAFKL